MAGPRSTPPSPLLPVLAGFSIVTPPLRLPRRVLLLNKAETDLFLGNGDGTFQRKKVISLPGEPFYNAENGLVPADFNSDGLLDFLLVEPGAFNVFVQK